MYQFSEQSLQYQARLTAFMDEYIYPNEHRYEEHLASAEDRFAAVPLMDELKEKARAAGLWNLFVPPKLAEFCDHDGLSNFDYAPLAEIMGRVLWCPEVFNCNAPDTGNMEVFMKYGTPEQQAQWLTPLLNGEIRSSYAMTEPQVASSDATNVELRIKRDGDEWVLNGRKWFITGAMYERTQIFIVMGKSDPDNENRHKQQSQVLVPRGTPGPVPLAARPARSSLRPPWSASAAPSGAAIPCRPCPSGAARGFRCRRRPPRFSGWCCSERATLRRRARTPRHSRSSSAT